MPKTVDRKSKSMGGTFDMEMVATRYIDEFGKEKVNLFVEYQAPGGDITKKKVLNGVAVSVVVSFVLPLLTEIVAPELNALAAKAQQEAIKNAVANGGLAALRPQGRKAARPGPKRTRQPERS